MLHNSNHIYHVPNLTLIFGICYSFNNGKPIVGKYLAVVFRDCHKAFMA